MELKCEVQCYDWGKKGLQSKVATLIKVADPDFEVDDCTPYAELWMGTHVNAPSRDKATDELLSSVLEEHPEYLGEPVRVVFGDHLPFLFKVLSINKALSIQTHPSKEHAEQLHEQKPDIYKDPNHKPELAIALTPFEALCGFRPFEEIRFFMMELRELRVIVTPECAEQLIMSSEGDAKKPLRECFRNMMTCPPDQVRGMLKQLLHKFSFFDEQQREQFLAPLVERLYEQFPDDVGCFVVYFLNFVKLAPHQAIYLGPNEPHAYISGDCMECMACSDNVVRAGLTPKFKDVDTLCSLLSYNFQPADKVIFKPVAEDQYCEVFVPPVKDFAVAKFVIPAGETFYRVPKRNSASILIVVGGSLLIDKVQVKVGTVLFLKANQEVFVENVTQDSLLFQAMANAGEVVK